MLTVFALRAPNLFMVCQMHILSTIVRDMCTKKKMLSYFELSG